MRDHLRLLRGLREHQGHVLRILLRRLGVHRAVAAVVPEARDRLLEAEPAATCRALVRFYTKYGLF